MKPRFGLSLSGGGYRAAAFHLGTLKKLAQLNLLHKVDVISTISGGSITGAYYCLNTHRPFSEIEKELCNSLHTKSVIGSVLRSRIFIRAALFVLAFSALAAYLLLTPYYWLSTPIIAVMLTLLVKFQFRLFPVSRQIEKAYDDFFFGHKQLGHLPPKPELAIGSTNLQSGRQFTFSGRKMEDSAYAYMAPPVRFKHSKFPVARAVMASSCVPFAFTPVRMDPEFFHNPADRQRVEPQLVDGGVYDNQGIHKLTQPGSSYECDIILTSDAGNKLPFKGSYNNVLVLLIRTMDVFMARIKNFQMVQNLYTNHACKETGYLSLGWDLAACIPAFIHNLRDGSIPGSVVDAHGFDPGWLQDVEAHRAQIQAHLENRVRYNTIVDLDTAELKLARSVGTNLTRLGRAEIDALVKHAANLTQVQVLLYCPSLTL